MEEEKTNVNVVDFVKEKFNEKPKKQRKPRKKRTVVKKTGKKKSEPKSKTPSPPPPEPKPVQLPPILSDELEVRVKYCNKRLYYCKTEADKQRYLAHLQKLRKRRVINV